MANTTNFGWETPDDTDLVKDGAAAIRILGSAIDTSLVDLKGGTTGQVLAKASNTDMDFTWTAAGDITAVSAGIGISGGGTSGDVTITNSMATAIDAKGDLVAGTGADAFSRLAVGANDTVLTADSSTATGLRWGTVASAPNTYLTTGQNIYLRTPMTTRGTFTVTTNTTYYTPVFLPVCTIDRLAYKSANIHTGTSSVRLGLYANSTSNLPSTLLLDAGTANVSVAGDTIQITTSYSITTAGVYYLAFNCQSASGTAGFVAVNGNADNHNVLFGAASDLGVENSSMTGFQQSGVTGAFANAGTLTVSTSSPAPYARIN